MKRYSIQTRTAFTLMVVAALLAFMTGIAAAKSTTTQDEKKLLTNITMLNKDARMLHGEKAVVDSLSRTFNVPPDRIRALRDRNMQYGDIAAVYAFADKLPGGITEENINKVVGLRHDNKKWPDIASSLDVNLGSVAGKLGGIQKDTHKKIEKAATEQAGGGAGGPRGEGGYNK